MSRGLHYKLKQQPEDFQVEELTPLTDSPPGQGSFAFYRLEKRGWATPDALAAVRRRWKLEPRRLSYGGLKDRHAHTVQYLTVFHGPQRNLTHHDVHVTYLGQVGAAYSSADVSANRFRLTLRDLDAAGVAAVRTAVEEVRREGVPNYFDDQRFGSVAAGSESGQMMIGRLLVDGRFEDALREALAAPYAHDRAEQKKEKAILTAHWGDWAACKEKLPRGHARSLADYLLHHPGDYRGAVARLRPELRGLYLSAYQSYLWNRLLARWLERHCRPEQQLRVRLRLGEVVMHRGLGEEQQRELAALRLPLPSARTHLDANDPRGPLVNEVLAAEGLELGRLKVPGVRELFFSKGERAALCLPGRPEHEEAADERHAGRRKVVLGFDLPRGAYATLLVKRVTVGEPVGPEEHDGDGN
jgi:tRNA pseudouridine13 synthase